MTRFMSFSAALMVALAQTAMATTISIDVTNSGFEDLQIASGLGDQYTAPFGTTHVNGPLPTIPGWTFGPSSGGSYDGILQDGLWGDYPFGHQDAFFEGTGSISQVLSGFGTGTATVSLYAQGRPMFAGMTVGPNPLQVTINGTPLTFGTSTTITPSVSSMDLYTSKPFSVAAGTNYTLVIAATIPYDGVQDLTSMVDNVSVSNTLAPEPSAIILIATGLIGLLAYAWRKRKE